jgi:hypothetical protein
VPSPEYIDRAKKFQRIFSSYFPGQLSDFHTACLEMEWIWYGFRNNRILTARRQTAKRELKKLVSTLRRLSKREVPYWQMAIQIRKDDEDKVRGYQSDIMDFLLSLDEMNNHDNLTDEVLAGFEEKALHEIDRLPERGNINWEAVEAVDRLRTLWWRNTGTYAPSRGLNPASAFCRFLGDGFAFLDVEADPVSAFKRWVEAYPYK